MRRVDDRQKSFAFADSPKGGGDDGASDVSEAKSWLLLIAKDRQDASSAARAGCPKGLLTEVVSKPNLAAALLKVVRNKGAAGVDGRSVEEVLVASRRLLPRLRDAILSGSYQPGDIRRVWIPKPGSRDQRGLGIPNVVDRWVQQAVLQVLEPIFEPTFHDSSHGFRRGRGARTAIAEAKAYVAEGHGFVVDLDLSKFFDRVHHQRLLSRLAQRVADSGVLKLVHRMLIAKVVMPNGTRVSTKEGTPQGGPLSPLLSNIVLDELDQELARRGLRFVRYADDCNIYVRSERSGQRVLGSTRRFIERRLRLVVNETKSSVKRSDQLNFLGFRLVRCSEGEVRVQLSERTRRRMNRRIRDMTPRTWGRSVSSCLARLNRYLAGWLAYFGICDGEDLQLLQRFDAHIRRRIRVILIRQKGRRPRFLARHLMSRGVSRSLASRTAYRSSGIWKRSNLPGVTRAYGNAWFHEFLVSLATTWRERHAPLRVLPEQLCLFGS